MSVCFEPEFLYIMVSAVLRFQCGRPADAVSTDYHRLIWCPYIPDNTESTGSGSQVDDGSMLLMVTHDNIVSFCFVSVTGFCLTRSLVLRILYKQL